MFRSNIRRKIVTFENITKRFKFKYTYSQCTPFQHFQQKYKDYQQSSVFPAILGLSTLTLVTAGLSYHYNDEVREKVAPYLPHNTKLFLDEFIGPHNISHIKKKLSDLPDLPDFSELFTYISSWIPGKSETALQENEAGPISTKMEEMVTIPLAVKKGSVKKSAEEREEERIKRQNDNLTNRMSEKSAEIDSVLNNVLALLGDYESKIKLHCEHLRRAIEDDGTTTPNPWEAVTAASQVLNSVKVKSEAEVKKLEMLLTHLEKLMADAAKSDDLKSNQSLVPGHQLILDVKYRVKQKQADIEKAQFNAQITNQYKELIQQGVERFKQELSSLTPNVSDWAKKQTDKLSNDDLNALIVHSHRRMHQLQARIAELESMEAIRLDAALAEQRNRDEVESNERVSRELERERMRISIEKIEELDTVRERHEVELRRALTRQASAHNEHINQLLRIQKDELDKQQDLLIREALIRERERMSASVEGWRMRVEGLEAAVEGRADTELQSREAQDMWVACHALHGVLSGHGYTPPLARYLASFEEAAQPASLPVLQVFIDSIPRCAIHQGVCTQNLLTRRFEKLKRVCRRVAMINETSASLPMYIVSWLRSLFIVTPACLIEAETEIDPNDESIDCHQIIASAELAVWRQDFDLAVRLLNLLKGMPRAVAHDWITDARTYLETKLAADALSAYTSSKTAGSIGPEEPPTPDEP